MQDEVNEKVIAVSVRGAVLTAHTLQNILRVLAAQLKEAQNHPKTTHGKQNVRQLTKQNTALSDIEITDGNIRAFEQTAKKYGIDYALKKDSTSEQPRYLVFFKGRDADVMTAAFREFSVKKLSEKEKPSVLQKLAKIKQKETVPQKQIQREDMELQR